MKKNKKIDYEALESYIGYMYEAIGRRKKLGKREKSLLEMSYFHGRDCYKLYTSLQKNGCSLPPEQVFDVYKDYFSLEEDVREEDRVYYDVFRMMMFRNFMIFMNKNLTLEETPSSFHELIGRKR